MDGLYERSQFWRDPKWLCLCLFVLYCMGTRGPVPEAVAGLQHNGTVHIPAAGETWKQEQLLGRPSVWAKGIHVAQSIYKYFPLNDHYPHQDNGQLVESIILPSHRGEERICLCCVHVNYLCVCLRLVWSAVYFCRSALYMPIYAYAHWGFMLTLFPCLLLRVWYFWVWRF